MSRIAKPVISVLLLTVLLCGTSFGSSMKKADELYDRGTFQEALDEYNSVLKETKDPETRWRAFFRACACLARLRRYGEAAQKLISAPLPEETPFRAHILTLKAEMLTVFLSQYSYVLERDVTYEQDSVDLFSLTRDQVRDDILKVYRQLWEMRHELSEMDIRKEKYFLNIQEIDLGMYPTFFDYFALSLTDFLVTGRGPYLSKQLIKPRGELLAVEEFTRPIDFEDPPGLLAAEIMEHASRLDPRGRLEATERWKIRRLLLPLRHSELFDLRNLAEDTTVNDLKDVAEYGRNSKNILLKWTKEFRTREAKAEAGYEAASIFNRIDEPLKAVKLCERIEASLPGTNASSLAKILRTNVQRARLNLKVKRTMPQVPRPFTLTTRDLKKVYFRIYRVDPYAIREFLLESRPDRRAEWFRILNDPDREWLKDFLPSARHTKQWSVETGDSGDYKTLTTEVHPPPLKAGIYLVVASPGRRFKPGRSLMVARFANVTDFVLMGTSGFTTDVEDGYYNFLDEKGPAEIVDEGSRFYALDARTGRPVGGVHIDVSGRLRKKWQKDFISLTTDSNGLASLSFPIEVSPRSSKGFNVDPLARKEEAFANWPGPQPVRYSAPNPIKLFIETGRPIYRPGEKVDAKVVVVKRVPEGFKTLGTGDKVKFSASDPSGKEFFAQDVDLNDFGSASITLEIPQGRMLGRYSLRAECRHGRFSNSARISFSVEEYKRPEFEILLKPADIPWKYEQPAEIKGSIKYYFGGPVPDIPVKYSIGRRMYVPWCYRYYWQHQGYPGATHEVATGETRTDSEGNFVIHFTPTPPPQTRYYGRVPDIAQFSVEVEGRDPGGRTIQAQQIYRAGKNAIYLTIEPKKGFYLEKETIEIKSKRMTVNDTPSKGTTNYEVFLLAATPTDSVPDELYPSRGASYWAPPLDIQLADVANDKPVARGRIEHDRDGLGIIKIPSLSKGAYRVVVKSLDQWGDELVQDKILVVAKDTSEAVPVNAPSVTLVEKDEYETGETARFIIGSGLASGTYHIELYAGQHFLSSSLIDDSKPVRLIEVPVTERMKGGFTVRWFGVKDLDVFYGQVTVSVPWKEKKLTVVLEPFDYELRPGQKAKVGITIRDAEGKPAEAEALALMYDRSLEYYMKSQNLWLDNLYRPLRGPVTMMHSAFERLTGLTVRAGLWRGQHVRFRPPKKPRLRGLDVGAGLRPGLGLSGVPLALMSVSVGGKDAEYEEAVTKLRPRRDFAPTAFFKPHITTGRDGTGSFSFTVPDQLTSWRTKVFAFTQDVKEGSLSAEAVTRKDLMVRLDLPRFFRERDRGTVTAIVHNETDAAMNGELSIGITEKQKAINKRVGLMDNKRKFIVKPHNLVSFDWTVDIPQGVSTYKVRVAVKTDRLSDSEERELPILPSRERLVESAFASLSGSESKTLRFDLRDDPSRISESMVLQIDPQLALSILNTIPFLVEYPLKTVTARVDRYVPLSIVNQIYKDHPAVKRAVHKIPQRKTIAPPWEKDDPRRLTRLMETPWLWQSEGRPTAGSLIDLLDPQIVEAQKKSTFYRLRSSQLPSGAFPWLPGGRPDLYMTLYVLAGLAEASRYGVALPKDLVGKALHYVNGIIPSQLKPEERSLSLVSYAAYVVTSYSARDFSVARTGHEKARSWTAFLEHHIDILTPLGKAYLAYTYHRLGDRKRAQEVLDMATDGAREDPVSGVYWTPEKYSWVWYSDTIEKHAFILRTLQQLRPEDERIPGMVKWLLFSRKGTVWKSTRASAAAVYALLDYLNDRGALATDERFRIKWGKMTDSRMVKADDWLAKPIRWQETAFEIPRDRTSATVQKEGPGLAYASLTWAYSTDQLPEASTPGMLEITRTFYRRVREGDTYILKHVKSGDKVHVGDQIEVCIKINTRSQFEYMHLKDPKAAGFESETLLSEWKHRRLRYYEEPRGSLTNFFLSWLPHGEYVVAHRMRPTKPGVYRIGAATLQSMYSPDMTAHSTGFIIRVVE